MGKTIEKMRANPKADWRIRDVEKACREAGAKFAAPPGSGSHFYVKMDGKRDRLTVPAHKPIKPHYIRQLIRYLQNPDTEL
ncbi:type II toxin-antitoxin system HicA family toxin [Aurantimonas sp. C2-6-R+9]|uniref:type II toxin-antitoxin system HicA family toxin n=1 Tax=unclassified Aurantimonas TaxID=2638230 RepID=UPI002E190CE1|nr:MULTISPECIES: type II toxin-antitoxin system HicA family toxin [unclassified Aurantimonas]MEC5291442.1 type II toxin-antitoxin system HicA family toxin [Aurantimonas sp. C2-3-R2]MEC5381706.1 type II toxin-antitoxin system HicA family toxin [Aurantimonas sp. C2-6-R+9]MEC5412530.1 type II toxin-antitoxin system HicA family toxin [Aurantimonas sp. C2-4-R8]